MMIFDQVRVKYLFTTARAKHYTLPNIPLVSDQVNNTQPEPARYIVYELVAIKLFLPEKP
ncbi:hypothetical protein D0C36_16290 [Mucilaginibacter conchicola]|uniref:Uncharacterized protein n=1 Tax=Mucilaginibacter conchicola TaxID=2303333 RepID=A0A372NWE0_9SPHI|nr:hypothetical protein [Mucilaginibacter conchicola]RFZ92947.1 hypothetical protein D0C36_16290 [Mucilaginibacter conchicola]